MRVRHIPKQLVLLPLAFCLSVSGCAYMIEGPTQEIRRHCRPDGNERIMVDGQAIDFADGVIVLQKTRETHRNRTETRPEHPNPVKLNV